MKKLLLTLMIGLSLTFASPSAKAHSAMHGYFPPYVWTGYWGAVPWGYGVFNWFYWPTPVFYGGTYWAYYNWAPYYATFGVIALSPSTGKKGIAWGYDTKRKAAGNAVDSCGVEDCRPVVWVQGGCAAMALSETEYRVGWAYADTKSRARSGATRSCRKGAENPSGCKVAAWVCSF